MTTVFLKKLGNDLALAVTEFMGSWWSVIAFASLFLCWIIINTIPYLPHIDEFPFSFMNLVLGVFAALTGPLVMIGSKSQEQRHKKLVEHIYEMEKRQNDYFDILIFERKKEIHKKEIKSDNNRKTV